MDQENTPGFPIGAAENVVAVLLLIAAAFLYAVGRESTRSEQLAIYVYSATCLICGMLCRVIVAIKQLKK